MSVLRNTTACMKSTNTNTNLTNRRFPVIALSRSMRETSATQSSQLAGENWPLIRTCHREL